MPSQSPSPRSEGRTRGAQALDRGLDLLSLISAAGGETGLNELSGSSGLAAGTVHRLLQSLLDSGMVRRTAGRRYALGPALISLGDQAMRALTAWGEPILRDLAQRTGESANLVVVHNDQARYVSQVQSSQPIRMALDPGVSAPLHATGAGKAMLAVMPDTDVRMLLARTGMIAVTSQTIVDINVLLADLGDIRNRGWAVDDEESTIGGRCVAVAVGQRDSLFSFSVSGPVHRMSDTRCAAIGQILRTVSSPSG